MLNSIYRLLFVVAFCANAEGFHTNGAINSIVQSKNHLFFAGRFTAIGDATENAILIDKASAKIQNKIYSGQKIRGSIDAAAARANGNGFYVAGSIPLSADDDYPFAGYLSADGSFEEFVFPKMDWGYVNGLFEYKGLVYVFGHFAFKEGVRNSVLLAFDPATKQVVKTNLEITGSYVLAYQLIGDDLYIADQCTINGVFSPGLSIYNLNSNTLETFDLKINMGSPEKLKVVNDKVYMAGSSFEANGQQRNFVEFDLKTKTMTNWQLPQGMFVESFENFDSKLIFSISGSENLGKTLVAFDANTHEQVTVLPNGELKGKGSVENLFSYKDHLYLIGIFGRFNHVLDININTGEVKPTVLPYKPAGHTSVVVANESQVLAGGIYTSLNSTHTGPLAVYDLETKKFIEKDFKFRTDWDDRAEIYNVTLSEDNKRLYLAGSFTSVLGEKRDSGVASISAGELALLDWQIKFKDPYDAFVNKVQVVNKMVIVAGEFNEINGSSRRNLAALDFVTALATDWDPQVNNEVTSIKYDKATERVWVTGSFTRIGDKRRVGIAGFDAAGQLLSANWSLEVEEDDFDETYGSFGITPAGDTLYLYGKLAYVDGEPIENIMKLNVESKDVEKMTFDLPASPSRIFVEDMRLITVGYTKDSIGDNDPYVKGIDLTTGVATELYPDSFKEQRHIPYAILKLEESDTYAVGGWKRWGGFIEFIH